MNLHALSPTRTPARCEACHRLRWLSLNSLNLPTNPDWWFCPECRGEPTIEVKEPDYD